VEALQEQVILLQDAAEHFNVDVSAVWKPREENMRADQNSHESEFDQQDYALNH
jgi:hypothetical protein